MLKRARRKATAEGRTLTSLIADGLRLVMAEPAKPEPGARPLPRIGTATGGLLPGIDLAVPSTFADSEDRAYLSRIGGLPGWCGATRALARRPSPVALSAVVRITTNPRVFAVPSAIEEAFGFCEDLLRQPHREIVHPGERHRDIFQRLCIETQTRGSRVCDA